MAAGVTIGTIWDRTTQVLGGRSAMIAAIAIPTLFVPSVVQGAIAAYVPEGATRSMVGGLVSLIVTVITIWGSLAIVAMATHPSTDRASAQRQATARFWPVLGVTLLLAIVLVLLILPPIIALAATGFDFQAASAAASADAPAAMPAPAASASLFIVLYGIAMLVLGLWASARLMLLNAVLLNERIGLGAFGRSIALTRGMTWKLLGVLILFLIVAGIAVLAAQSVVGLVFRLILGADNIATSLFIGSIAGAAASTALLSVAYVFTAQLYVATREKHDPE